MRISKILAFAMLLFSTLNFNSYGQTIKLLKNFPTSSPERQGMSSLVLDSLMLFLKNTKEKGTVVFSKTSTQEKYPLVFSTTNYASGFDSTLQLPVALQANFKNENEFVLHFNQLCRINKLSPTI